MLLVTINNSIRNVQKRPISPFLVARMLETAQLALRGALGMCGKTTGRKLVIRGFHCASQFRLGTLVIFRLATARFRPTSTRAKGVGVEDASRSAPNILPI